MKTLRDIDPLLAIAKTLTIIVMVLMAIAAAATVIAIPTIFVMQSEIATALASSGHHVALARVLLGLAILLTTTAVMLAGLFRFVQLLGRIIDTVGRGDPFTPENARRLLHMAWIALGVQAVGWIMEVESGWLNSMLPGGVGGKHWHVSWFADYSVSGSGLVLVVILFILARVFRQGAEMREDLEGTV